MMPAQVVLLHSAPDLRWSEASFLRTPAEACLRVAAHRIALAIAGKDARKRCVQNRTTVVQKIATSEQQLFGHCQSLKRS